MKKMMILAFGLGMILGLASCGLTKDDLGMAKSKPDETKVSRRNQLVLPPDFEVRPAVPSVQNSSVKE